MLRNACENLHFYRTLYDERNIVKHYKPAKFPIHTDSTWKLWPKPSHSKKSCTQQCIDVYLYRLGWWLIKKSELNLLHWQIEHLTSQLVALRLSISIISMDWSFIVECQCVIKHAQMVNTIDSSVNSWLFAAGLYYEVGLKAHQFNETPA